MRRFFIFSITERGFPISVTLTTAREIPNKHANYFFKVIYHVCHVRLHIDSLYSINASLQSRLLRFKCFPL